MTANIVKRNNGRADMPVVSFGGWVDQIFHDNLDRLFNDNLWGFEGLSHKTSVPVNIRETEKSYEMELVAPGLKKEDFKLNVSGDLLTVSFEHTEETREENKNWLQRDYQLRSFTRSFNLGNTIDADKIIAKYNDGILYLTLPKKENAQQVSKVIAIQ